MRLVDSLIALLRDWLITLLRATDDYANRERQRDENHG
jgi:hypothetical protein